ncbi:MAG: peptide chain release factor N(5)-glutamine methyltransferase [Treponema sp.]|nr:peptide chain release factor N(5)-glutamine methyltransferase [Treponema sp.]
MNTITIRDFKNSATKELQGISPSPELDVQVLLSHALKYDKTQLLLFAENHIPDDKLVWLNNAIGLRKTKLPVAYITGVKEFYGYDFFVTPDVLIPKPDTEILVEHAVELIMERIGSGGDAGTEAPARPLKILDMCTGSGCIGLSVMKTLYALENVPVENLPQMTLVDISEPALAIAKKNASALLPDSEILQKITFIQSDLFGNVEGKFDFILTNPPYIPSKMVDELLKDGRNEPRLALDGDMALRHAQGPHASGVAELVEAPQNDGTHLIKILLQQSCEHLANNGTILMETGEYNAQATADFAGGLGFTTQLHTDLEGQLRVVEMTHEQ